jgi:SWI/SNF-related matrix-associated actin-dependent regulator 1 of chromatin subfamily A
MGYLAPNNHVATYRKELGMAKLPHAVTIIKSILEETDESILVFAIHREVTRGLVEALEKYSPLGISGDTPVDRRQEIVREFQENPKRRLFVGNVQAAGVGFTLTKATRVLFVEASWTPADNDQASDRAHRVGQTDNVYVQYLVFKNSIDRSVMETIFSKKRVTAHI